jgi:hypothetical protein
MISNNPKFPFDEDNKPPSDPKERKSVNEERTSG